VAERALNKLLVAASGTFTDIRQSQPSAHHDESPKEPNCHPPGCQSRDHDRSHQPESLVRHPAGPREEEAAPGSDGQDWQGRCRRYEEEVGVWNPFRNPGCSRWIQEPKDCNGSKPHPEE